MFQVNNLRFFLNLNNLKIKSMLIKKMRNKKRDTALSLPLLVKFPIANFIITMAQ